MNERERRKEYVSDLDPLRLGELMPFTIIFSGDDDDDQPWEVVCEAVSDTHHTLDELLYWNLIIGERFISEELRQKINNDWHTGAKVE